MSNEMQIENDLIAILSEQENQWTYRSDIKSEADLWINLRKHINRVNIAALNGVPLTDDEFHRLMAEFKKLTVTPFKASQWLRGENGVAQIHINRDDTSSGKVSLILFSNKDIGGGISSYEIVNQIRPDADKDMRGDVTMLINGLPVIHIELKSDSAKDGYMQAVDQIKRYAENGFFDGIYATTQIFVASNKLATRYFARPTSNDAKAFELARKFLFNWRDHNNNPVENLFDFARELLRIPAAHELVSRYTILVDDKKSQKFLMVLRPYQIHAIKCIKEQTARHEGGFIWHATGSGKTVTSFVATKLLAQASIGVVRTVMLVDRIDLDSQTKTEFSKFASEYHTGLSTGNATDNTLIVGTDSSRELADSLLSEKNNNTIIVTTAQKLGRVISRAKESKDRRFEKLRGEHITFIVDECHRAVSDEQMKEIKEALPSSTWFGFTGTPIFEENKKQENGTFARTTYQQYGNLLHAYTTKNAMDDQSVLNFQVEYYCLLDEDDKQRYLFNKVREKYPKINPVEKLNSLSCIEKERLLDAEVYEGEENADAYIEAMFAKIFHRQSIIEKFKVVNGYPTMSAILTTRSIAQAKRICRKLQEMKEANTLLCGKEIDERHTLTDKDFPRVAITYSTDVNQDEMTTSNDELDEFIQQYNALFGTNYSSVNVGDYNRNINSRLARKDAQYQKDGNWLDLVIVVDRLLTGFDAPTIQTLYIDRELRYQGLLQAFSRTNRLYPDKKVGMIVTFRSPETMRENVRDAIRLFSNEGQNWEDLVPLEYPKVKALFLESYESLRQAKNDLADDPNNITKKLTQIKAFQALEKTYRALKSYDDYAEEAEELSPIAKVLPSERGHAENLKGEIRAELHSELDDYQEELLNTIEFNSGQRAMHKDYIDSLYINKLLDELTKDNPPEIRYEIRAKLEVELEAKPEIVRNIYEQIQEDIDLGMVMKGWDYYFSDAIDDIIRNAAEMLQVDSSTLRTSLNEYHASKSEVPYINVIVENSELNKDDFEDTFGEKYRKRSIVMHDFWKEVIESQLLPLKEEIHL